MHTDSERIFSQNLETKHIHFWQMKSTLLLQFRFEPSVFTIKSMLIFNSILKLTLNMTMCKHDCLVFIIDSVNTPMFGFTIDSVNTTMFGLYH